jgi:D-alanyl-D-alanine carboxypeptidase
VTGAAAPAYPAYVDRLSPAQSARVSSLVARALRDEQTPAASVAIVRGGRLVFAKGFGLRDPPRALPADARTCYEIGSVTKTLVAALVLRLAERHVISLDDPVTRYLPSFARARAVHIRHLLAQTSGIRDYNDALFLATVVPHVLPGRVDRDAILSMLARWPLAFEPGTRFAYSNANYLVLGIIAERATGQSLAALLQREVFGPLGMRRTALDAEPATDADGALGYTKSPLGPVAVPPWDPQLTFAAGGLRSSAADLATFDVALASGRVISPQSFAEMTSATATGGGRDGYGYGLFSYATGGVRVVWHDGTVLGFRAMNALVPERGDAVVVLANSDYFHATLVAMQIEAAVLGVPGGTGERFDFNLPLPSAAIGLALAALVVAASTLRRARRATALAGAVAVYATATVYLPAGLGLAAIVVALVAWPSRHPRAPLH